MTVLTPDRSQPQELQMNVNQMGRYALFLFDNTVPSFPECNKISSERIATGSLLVDDVLDMKYEISSKEKCDT